MMAVDVNQIINDSRQKIEDNTNKFNTLAGEAITASEGFANFDPFVAFEPKLREAPPAFQGNFNLSAEFLKTYNDAIASIKPEFAAALSSFLANWFPDCIVNNTNSWICNTILTGGTGLPPGIEDAIWFRARRRELIEADRMENEALTQGAARGFSIPTGSITYRMLQVQQDATDKSSSIIRDEAIKHIDIIIENVRFAVDQGVKVRGQVIGALGEFMRVYFMPEQLALQKAEGILRAKQLLITSAADYYRALIAEADLSIQTQQINAVAYSSSQGNVAQNILGGTTLRAKVTEGLAEAFGQAAASAASGILGIAQDQTIHSAV